MKNATAGFTLIELLIVIAIIGILAAVLLPNVLGARAKANNTAANQYAGQVATWLASADNTANDATKQAALKAVKTCIDPLLVAEGASAALPSSVSACTVTYDATSQRYTVDVTSQDGKTQFSKVY